MKLKYAEKQSCWGEKKVLFIWLISTVMIYTQKWKRREETYETKQLSFMSITTLCLYTCTMLSWLQKRGGFIDIGRILFYFIIITEMIFYN